MRAKKVSFTQKSVNGSKISVNGRIYHFNRAIGIARQEELDIANESLAFNKRD